jgi:hypothetical protein
MAAAFLGLLSCAALQRLTFPSSPLWPLHSVLPLRTRQVFLQKMERKFTAWNYVHAER